MPAMTNHARSPSLPPPSLRNRSQPASNPNSKRRSPALPNPKSNRRALRHLPISQISRRQAPTTATSSDDVADDANPFFTYAPEGSWRSATASEFLSSLQTVDLSSVDQANAASTDAIGQGIFQDSVHSTNDFGSSVTFYIQGTGLTLYGPTTSISTTYNVTLIPHTSPTPSTPTTGSPPLPTGTTVPGMGTTHLNGATETFTLRNQLFQVSNLDPKTIYQVVLVNAGDPSGGNTESIGGVLLGFDEAIVAGGKLLDPANLAAALAAVSSSSIAASSTAAATSAATSAAATQAASGEEHHHRKLSAGAIGGIAAAGALFVVLLFIFAFCCRRGKATSGKESREARMANVAYATGQGPNRTSRLPLGAAGSMRKGSMSSSDDTMHGQPAIVPAPAPPPPASQRSSGVLNWLSGVGAAAARGSVDHGNSRSTAANRSNSLRRRSQSQHMIQTGNLGIGTGIGPRAEVDAKHRSFRASGGDFDFVTTDMLDAHQNQGQQRGEKAEWGFADGGEDTLVGHEFNVNAPLPPPPAAAAAAAGGMTGTSPEKSSRQSLFPGAWGPNNGPANGNHHRMTRTSMISRESYYSRDGEYDEDSGSVGVKRSMSGKRSTRGMMMGGGGGGGASRQSGYTIKTVDERGPNGQGEEAEGAWNWVKNAKNALFNATAQEEQNPGVQVHPPVPSSLNRSLSGNGSGGGRPDSDLLGSGTRGVGVRPESGGEVVWDEDETVHMTNAAAAAAVGGNGNGSRVQAKLRGNQI